MPTMTVAGIRFAWVSRPIAQRWDGKAVEGFWGGWNASINGCPEQLVLATAAGLIALTDDTDIYVPWKDLTGYRGDTLVFRGGDVTVVLLDGTSRDQLWEIVMRTRPTLKYVPPPPTPPPRPPSAGRAPPPPILLSTTPTLDGHEIVGYHGLVSAAASASGWTAAKKGALALGEAYDLLSDGARELGANAVVGVQASSFGAKGGLTNVVGGDAVGVLLLGTAVTVAARPAAAAPPGFGVNNGP